MYDRKTWIVVITCSVLIAVNYWFMQKNAREAALRNPPPAVASVDPAAPEGEKPGVLEIVDPEPLEAATTHELRTAGARYTFTSLGGGLLTAELLKYPAVLGSEEFVTINKDDTNPIGAISEGADGIERFNYTFVPAESQEGRKLVFTGTHPSGLKVKKVWELVPAETPGADYQLDFRIEIASPADAAQQTALDRFSLYLGRAQPLQAGESSINPASFLWSDEGDFTQTKSSSFTGGWFSKSKSLISESAEKLHYAGVSSQFFATVLRPLEPASGGIWAKTAPAVVPKSDKQELAIRAGLILPNVTLAPAETRSFSYRLYTGPKENQILRDIGEGMADVMDYGWPIFAWPARFMNFLLVHSHNVVAKVSDKWSWGIAVIVVTLIVRTLMWPLYAKSNKTMKRMAKLKPDMDRLKEKYPDDPAKMQQEVMGLYRKYGINPVGGCLPMFAQIPIFFGFFRMLQHAVEMRGHGFLWVDDLSMPDTIGHIAGFPINILPIVMGLTSFLQMQMMPNTTADKTQMAVMKFMPLLFLVFCYNYASALALYWTTSNLFSILQTWITQRMPEPELKERKGGSGKSFMERMAAAAEEAQRQQKMRQARGHVVEEEKPKKPRGPRTGG